MFKVMTWNVENLFRPGADAGPTTEPVYQAKLQGVGGDDQRAGAGRALAAGDR